MGAEPLWRSPNHYRLLLNVDCRGVSRSNSPAAVDLDFAQTLRDQQIAGTWDEHTIEVIAYDCFGLPKVFDASRTGYERYLLPWRLDRYYAIDEVTLRFVVPDETCTTVAVFFDTVESGLASPRRYRGLVGDGDFNHDGRKDLVFSDQDNPGFYFLENVHTDAVDWNRDGDIDIITGQGHGGSGLRFFERDYIEDCINDTHPIVEIAAFQRSKSSLLDVVRRYADAMIEHGRDTYGPQKSGLLLSALDRRTLKPLELRPEPPGGVRRGDRTGLAWRRLTGSNPHLDQNLLRVLYSLSEITGQEGYREVADHEIQWFFQNTQSPVTGLLPWGEHLSWDVMLDRPISSGTDYTHEFARPWVLWDRSFELAPEASKKLVFGLWNHQIANRKTGAFDRHAPYNRHGPRDGRDFPRHAGFYIHTWAHAYKHTKDETFPRAIEVVLARFERRRTGPDGVMKSTIGPLDVETAASMVPDPLASRLREFAKVEDQLILENLRQLYGQPDGDLAFEPTWQAGYAAGVTADWAMFGLARYEQVKKKPFRDVVIAVADAYVDALPDEDVDVWPMSFAHIISAQVAAYRLTNRNVYLEEAGRFARMAVDTFFQDSPLPRASFKTDHYETITGADSLAVSLLEVHAAEHDLKVVIPANTIDR